MTKHPLLADSDHPLVRKTAAELTSDGRTPTDRTAAIFEFVRDQIPFGFPPRWDAVRASETLQYGIGYCNTKATLFHALCRATGVPSRIHTGSIDLQIMRGIFPSYAFPFLPSAGGHTWIEVQIDGQWQPVDSYINDRAFYEKALRQLRASGRATAFSISEAQGTSSCRFNLGGPGFVHMGAVVEDHRTWDDFAEYMASERYVPMKRWQLTAYPALAKLANRNIDRIRRS